MKTGPAVRAFYTVVLVTALAGSTSAAAGWLGVPVYVALLPVAAVELGGVVLMMHAAERRELGESALAARLLSAAVAAGAVALNWFGHTTDRGQAAFFAGMSALGYLVYLLMSAAARRDALRAANMLPPAAPAYGLVQWLRHPGITRRARRLALATPTLGLYGSLDAAAEQVRAERREAAIAKALDALIRRAAGPVMADIAVHTYDPAAIAHLIAEQADYAGYARLLGRDLTPERLAGTERPDVATADDLTALVDATAPTMPELVDLAVTRHLADVPVAAPEPSTYRPRLRAGGLRRPRRMAAKAPAVNVTVMAPARASRPATDTATDGRPTPTRKAASRTDDTAQRVAAALAKKPAMTQADVAKLLGKGERTIRRYWPKAPATVNGHDHAEPATR